MGGQQGSSDFEAAGIREHGDLTEAGILRQLRFGGSCDVGAAWIWEQPSSGGSSDLERARSWQQQGAGGSRDVQPAAGPTTIKEPSQNSHRNPWQHNILRAGTF